MEKISLISIDDIFDNSSYFKDGIKIKLELSDRTIERIVIKQQFYDIVPFSTISQCAVYVILNAETGEFYIGSTNHIYNRLHQHRFRLKNREHNSKKLQKSFDTCQNGFLDVCIILTANREEAFDIEQHFLDLFKTYPNILNVAFNARSAGLGLKMSEEQKRYFSSLYKDKPMHDAETRRKISLAGMGRKISIENRRKLSLAFKGKPLSEETKRKMAIARERIGGSSRAKSIIVNGIEYPSIKLAALAHKTPYCTFKDRLKRNCLDYSFVRKIKND